MRLGRMRRLAAATVVVGALVPAGAGAATACDGGHHDRTTAAVFAARHTLDGRHHRGVLIVASNYLGLSRATIVSKLESGMSLAEIANATPDKSDGGLVDAYIAAIKARLDKWVAAGKITSARESAILTRVQPWVVKLVNAHWLHH